MSDKDLNNNSDNNVLSDRAVDSDEIKSNYVSSTNSSSDNIDELNDTYEPFSSSSESSDNDEVTTDTIIDSYSINANNVVVEINILSNDESSVNTYNLSISNITETTKIILEKIKAEFISKVMVKNDLDTNATDMAVDMKEKFKFEMRLLIGKYFPGIDAAVSDMLLGYLVQENLGLGKVEILLKDELIEEIVINNHIEPVSIYHIKYGWLRTNVFIHSETKIRHYASIIARNVGKEITLLNPLLDARLTTGDRVNATLNPITSKGNTITIRKFAKDPWTITKFLRSETISYEAAALIWLAIQNELSIIVAGGTGSGKTSMLNVLAAFYPSNQRIISVEDTRELTLPKTLHWVPMSTRLPNPEGKGGVSMLDCVINTLRMRPDRIIVGEIRRAEEAQVLFEAMHTGHSVYGTLHANNVDQVVMRLTNKPIDIPKMMLSSLSMVVVQNRNRRTGKRRTLQIAELLSDGSPNVLMQYNVFKDKMEKVNNSKVIMEHLGLYTGLTPDQLDKDLAEKIRILKWFVDNDVDNVHDLGILMSRYYAGKLNL